jgi:hypothetical protein
MAAPNEDGVLNVTPLAAPTQNVLLIPPPLLIFFPTKKLYTW